MDVHRIALSGDARGVEVFGLGAFLPFDIAAQTWRLGLRHWIPRNTVTVDIIKGTDTSQKKFSQ